MQRDAQLMSLLKVELQHICQSYEHVVSGNKNALLTRIRNGLVLNDDISLIEKMLKKLVMGNFKWG